MSWHYLTKDSGNLPCSQGQEEVSSEDISWDGEQFVPSKSRTTLDGYCSPDSAMESSHDSRYGMTLRRSTGTPGEGELMWYQGDSPVRTYQPQGKGQGLEGNDQDYGPRWQESLARYNPETYSWKTHQCLLLGGLESFSETWPQWGTMQDGECSEVTTPTCRQEGIESGLLPAPLASDWKATGRIEILARDWEDKTYGHQKRPSMFYASFYGEKMPPEFEECLMMFPIGWTDLKPLGMGRIRTSWLLPGRSFIGVGNE